MEFSAPTPITAMSLPLVKYLQMYFIDLTEWQDSTSSKSLVGLDNKEQFNDYQFQYLFDLLLQLLIFRYLQSTVTIQGMTIIPGNCFCY
jgi:hypothetical protein